MSQVTVAATDTQGKVHIFDKPTPFNPANDPFLFGLERGRKEAAKEVIQYILEQGTIEVADGEEQCYYIIDDDIKAIKEKFGLEI